MGPRILTDQAMTFPFGHLGFLAAGTAWCILLLAGLEGIVAFLLRIVLMIRHLADRGLRKASARIQSAHAYLSVFGLISALSWGPG